MNKSNRNFSKFSKNKPLRNRNTEQKTAKDTGPGRKPFKNDDAFSRGGFSKRPSFKSREEAPQGGPRKRFSSNSESKPRRSGSKPYKNEDAFSRDGFSKRLSFKSREEAPQGGPRKRFSGNSESKPRRSGGKPFKNETSFSAKKHNTTDGFRTKSNPLRSESRLESQGPIRLNKYLSNAGIASRREADQLILSGAVKVNGIVVDQLGTKIQPGDQVVFNNQNIQHDRKVYLLLNKPKDCITTVEDPRGRKTVMDYIQGACKERVYPVGRLDRNTTGVLLFTNDGDLTTRLTHPKHGIRKIYQVTLNRNLKPEDFKQLVDGIELEDGPIRADDVSFEGTSRKEVGIELHSGRNRIVRRMFEHLGYEVIKLDRVMFAGLTKKELSRGRFRMLSPKEVGFLKMLS